MPEMVPAHALRFAWPRPRTIYLASAQSRIAGIMGAAVARC